MENQRKQSYEEKVTRTLLTLKDFLDFIPEGLKDIKLGENVEVAFDIQFSIMVRALEDCLCSIEIGKNMEDISA